MDRGISFRDFLYWLSLVVTEVVCVGRVVVGSVVLILVVVKEKIVLYLEDYDILGIGEYVVRFFVKRELDF